MGDRFRKRRLDLGLLQKEVAQKIGVKEESIYNWVNNRHSPSLRIIPRIFRFLGPAYDDSTVSPEKES